MVADFDREDVEPPLRFLRCAHGIGIASYLERSKSKGWHAWTFFQNPGVNAAKARAVVRWILAEIESPDTEVFPKQDRLVGRNHFGNFVNAPLFGALVPQGRTVFVNPEDDLEPWPDQWTVLESATRVSESTLDRLIEARHISLLNQPSSAGTFAPSRISTHPTYSLPPCAQRCLHRADDAICDDGLYCNGTERCDVNIGCQAGTAPDCDDRIACTRDACDEAERGCTHSPDSGRCDDGLFCNGAETCNPTYGCEAGTPPVDNTSQSRAIRRLGSEPDVSFGHR